MRLNSSYQHRSKTEMLHSFLQISWPAWRFLESAEVTAFFGVLMSFIRAGFNDEGIDVPVEVAEVWKRSKERICARYLEDESQAVK